MECDYDIVGTKDGGYVQEIGKSDDGKYIYIFSFSVVLDSADLKRSPSHNLPVEKERRYKFLNND